MTWETVPGDKLYFKASVRPENKETRSRALEGAERQSPVRSRNRTMILQGGLREAAGHERKYTDMNEIACKSKQKQTFDMLAQQLEYQICFRQQKKRLEMDNRKEGGSQKMRLCEQTQRMDRTGKRMEREKKAPSSTWRQENWRKERQELGRIGSSRYIGWDSGRPWDAARGDAVTAGNRVISKYRHPCQAPRGFLFLTS